MIHSSFDINFTQGKYGKENITILEQILCKINILTMSIVTQQKCYFHIEKNSLFISFLLRCS